MYIYIYCIYIYIYIYIRIYIYTVLLKSLDHGRYQAYFHNLIHLKILTNTKDEPN